MDVSPFVFALSNSRSSLRSLAALRFSRSCFRLQAKPLFPPPFARRYHCSLQSFFCRMDGWNSIFFLKVLRVWHVSRNKMALSVECPVWRWECVGQGKVFQVGPVAFQALLLYASEPSRVCKEVLHELCEAELKAVVHPQGLHHRQRTLPRTAGYRWQRPQVALTRSFGCR